MNPIKMPDKQKIAVINKHITIIALSLLPINFLMYSFFELNAAKNILRGGEACLLAVLLLFQVIEKKITACDILLFLITAFLILVGGISGVNMAFLIVVTVVLGKNELHHLYKIALYSMAVLTVVVIVCLMLKVRLVFIYTLNGRTRNTLGFVNVNAASMFGFILQIVFLLYRKTPKWYEWGIVITSSILLFYFTDSRTAFLGMCLMAIFYVLMQKVPQKVCEICMYIGCGICFLSVFCWTLPIVNSSLGNKILSLRPTHFAGYIQKQSFFNFLFGGSTVSEIDNAYLLLLYNGGIMVYALIAYAVFSAICCLIKRKQRMELSFVLTMVVCSMLEGTLIRPEMLCTPLFWIIVYKNQPESLKMLDFNSIIKSKIKISNTSKKRYTE